MLRVWVQLSVAAALALLVATPVKAEQGGIRTVAEELGERSKAPDTSSGAPKDKLSDSAVRVMSSFAWSILPEELPGPDGKPVKIDKSDPNKFLLPVDDARRIIRIATRSAYAEVCNLPELEKLNYETMIRGEHARKVWSKEQLMFVNFLHMFAVSYFTGNMKITEEPDDKAAAPTAPGIKTTPPPQANAAPADSAPADAAPAGKPSGGTADAFAPKKPTCTPEQKDKVTKAINAYAQAAPPAAAAAPVPGAAQPAPAAPAPQSTQSKQPAPVAGGSN